MWQRLRLSALLLVLTIVAAQAWIDHLATTSWKSPLWVGLYPVNGDRSAAAARYIAALEPAAFASIGEFFDREGQRYGLAVEHPLHIVLYDEVAELPPALDRGMGMIGTAWWSLRLRAYAWRRARAVPGPPPRIRVFILFHDPARTPSVPHSLGLEKGLVGVVYAFASAPMQGANAIVVAHELLHTLGATDKYDPETLAPRYPEGYGAPAQSPRFPQPTAEIMAGRRALTASRVEMPASLESVVLGPLTAREIRWLR